MELALAMLVSLTTQAMASATTQDATPSVLPARTVLPHLVSLAGATLLSNPQAHVLAMLDI